jgi:DNA-binding IclR family transcriptional regulator
MAKGRGTVQSAGKVLDVLDLLTRNFAHGYSPTEISKATGLEPSQVTRYVETLIEKGWAEIIPATRRIRLAHRVALVGIQVIQSLDQESNRIEESRQRITRAAGGPLAVAAMIERITRSN